MAKTKSTLKQRLLAKQIAENVGTGKPLGRMMLESGYAKSVSKTPHRTLECKGMIAILDSVGLTDEYIANKLIEGCDSTKPISCNVYIKDKTSGKELGEMIEAGEATKDFVDIEDMPTRHKYLTTALEIRGHVRQNGNEKVPSVINIIHSYRTKPKRDKKSNGSSRRN